VGLARTVGPLDIVGFSAGAVATLEALLLEPTLFRRAALLGIGDGMWRPANGAEPDVRSGAVARLMSRLIESAGNDAESVNAYAGNIVPRPMSEIASIGLPVMLVIGDDDPVGPAHTLSATIPHAELTTLPRTDHFATTSSYRCQEAVLDFLLREVPATC
jgi:pimeloyl-ACP methyl ester carboxylesterase